MELDPSQLQAVVRALRSPIDRCSLQAGGRVIHAQCAKRRYARGAITLRITTQLATRFVLVRQPAHGAALDAAFLKMPELTPHALDQPHLAAKASDPHWGTALLGDPRFSAGALPLLNALGPATYVILSIRPGMLVFSLIEPDHDRIDEGVVAFWIAHLATLLEAAEGLPPSAIRELPNAIERMADDPAKTQKWVLIGMTIFILVLTVVAVGIVLILRALTH